MKSELKKLKDKLWQLCKEITRKKYGNVCFTCGAGDLEGSNWHTGHFINDSICSTATSYDLRNLRPQCYRCNIHLSGNWVAFYNKMVALEGEEYVKKLMDFNQKSKGLMYDILWYRSKVREYEVINSRF